MELVRRLSKLTDLLAILTARVQSLELTRWRRGASSWKLFCDFHVCAQVHIRMGVCVYMGMHSGQQRVPDSLELELEVIVNHQM